LTRIVTNNFEEAEWLRILFEFEFLVESDAPRSEARRLAYDTTVKLARLSNSIRAAGTI
jgi:hypothetical protein